MSGFAMTPWLRTPVRNATVRAALLAPRVGGRVALLAASALVFAAGCGHPATEEECKALFDKSVEVEMRELAKADDVVIAKKKEELRKGFENDLKACIGKRVTDASMNCVRKATTAAELTDCSH